MKNLTMGQQIRIAREALGWTTAELAVRIGVSRTAVEGWEDGSYEPRAHRMRKIEEVMGVQLSLSDPKKDVVGLPANVRPEHIELAIQLSRMPKAEYEVVRALARSKDPSASYGK